MQTGSLACIIVSTVCICLTKRESSLHQFYKEYPIILHLFAVFLYSALSKSLHSLIFELI